MAKVLCIAGMHRSGTSLTASWLEKCGLAIDAGSFISSSQWNPKGHFEDKEIVKLHENAINDLIPNSQGWKLYKARQFLFQEKQLQQARELILKRNQNSNFWGWKDPRTTHFLKQWKTLIPELKVLIVWRSAPLVVKSLVKRAKEQKLIGKANNLQINAVDAIKLWVSHNQLLYEFKKNYPDDTVLLGLNTLLKRDQDLIHIIKDKLGLDLIYTPINLLFDEQLLNETKIYFPISLIEYIPKVSSLTRSLMENSDLKYI